MEAPHAKSAWMGAEDVWLVAVLIRHTDDMPPLGATAPTDRIAHPWLYDLTVIGVFGRCSSG